MLGRLQLWLMQHRKENNEWKTGNSSRPRSNHPPFSFLFMMTPGDRGSTSDGGAGVWLEIIPVGGNMSWAATQPITSSSAAALGPASGNPSIHGTICFVFAADVFLIRWRGGCEVSLLLEPSLIIFSNCCFYVSSLVLTHPDQSSQMATNLEPGFAGGFLELPLHFCEVLTFFKCLALQ